MRKSLLFLTLIFFANILFSQNPYPPTPAKERIASFEKKKALLKKSMVANIPFQSVGPTVFSGRVVDLDVSPDDPTHFYVAYASGGLWKTVNNGTTFTPIFDNEMVLTIGDIAVDWKNNIIWVGTGENNSSRSSYSGVGIYKSTDDGKTWTYKGLPESHHIGRIVLHPTDPNIAWVAALGHLYSPSKDRGIYRTTDGGNTWKQTLFVNENAGGVDLIVSKENPNKLYAATWQRKRRAWNFVESGSGSGIYKSMDGGKTWEIMSAGKSQFPQGDGVGRIGLALFEKNGKEVLYAVLDNYFRRPKDKKNTTDGYTKDDFREMSKADFLKIKKGKIADFLKNNNFPKKYSAEKVIQMMKEDKIKPLALTEYLEDANSLLFDTPVIGAEVYRSDDGGEIWHKTHEGFLDQVYNSYGYYFGNIRVSPHDADKIYIMGFRALRSDDGGKTFKLIGADNVHVDHHACWLDPNRAGHMIIGNDGGVNISYDDGVEWIKCNSPAVGQFYYAAVDNEEPFNIYGGLQDNGVWVGPSDYKAGSKAWHNSGHYPYKAIMGGDGMQVAVDLRDNNTIYTGFQFGNYFRVNRATGDTKYLTPKHELGERPLRWNWQAPIHLSIHNQDILYMGANKLFRSMNQGDDFSPISKDLTNGGKEGDVAYGTLTAIHESPLRFGLIYVGSDDGLVHVTKDGGSTWEQINKGLPEHLWVTRIQASKYEEGTVYLALNGLRWDNFESHIYQSIDYGKTWKRIGLDLPLEPVNVIKEDPENKQIIYVGTDHGVYVSFNQGESFMMMNKDFPSVAVHDIVIHPAAKQMIVATHGRSFYKVDVSSLQQLNGAIFEKNLSLFAVKKIKYSSRWGSHSNVWGDPFEPEMEFSFFSKTKGVTGILIKNKDGAVLSSFSHKTNKGINYVKYDLSINPSKRASYERFLNKNNKGKLVKIKDTDTKKTYLRKGVYTIEITKSGVVE
ncbi:MAG TPA: glycosyl hydrolase, partial [Phaeodactylibacter sp.]|nr:glycosyl hydrolase [Phaeodactylibacter sp.]